MFVLNFHLHFRHICCVSHQELSMMTIVNREAPWFVWMEGWTATGERIKKSVSRRKWEIPPLSFWSFWFSVFCPTQHNTQQDSLQICYFFSSCSVRTKSVIGHCRITLLDSNTQDAECWRLIIIIGRLSTDMSELNKLGDAIAISNLKL